MWHVLKTTTRTIARKVTKERAEWLHESQGGEVLKEYTPRPFSRGFTLANPFEGEVVGHTSNTTERHTYPQIHIYADGNLVTKVTRKQDAFRIMSALKRDYKDIVVCIGSMPLSD